VHRSSAGRQTRTTKKRLEESNDEISFPALRSGGEDAKA
jgi:hypothetical protein